MMLAGCGAGAGVASPRSRGLALETSDTKAVGAAKLAQVYERTIVVLVGIDDYATFPKLSGGVRDARAMADAFRGDGVEVISILDSEATKARLERLLRDELPSRVRERDRVIVYFAGHGATMNSGAGVRGFLVPIDAAKEHIEASSISMESLQQWLAKYRSKHVMFVADACYSGLAIASRAAGVSPTVPDYMQKVSSSRVRVSLVAGMADEEAVEWRGHGLLTSVLLEALGGAADINADGLITSDEIASFVKPNVARIASELGHVQNPQLGRVGEGEIMFASPHAGVTRRATSAKVCPANQRVEGGVCVPATNRVCLGGGVYRPNEGCSASVLVKAALHRESTIAGDLVVGAYAGVIGEFTVPGESAKAPDPEARMLALRAALAKEAAGANKRDLAYELAMLTWDRSQRALEEAHSGCPAAPTQERCKSAAVARSIALYQDTLAHLGGLNELGAELPPEMLYRHAIALLEGGDGRAAAEKIGQIKDPKLKKRGDVLHTMGEALFLSGDLASALKFYDLALRDPELATSRYTQYKQAFCLINLDRAPDGLRRLSEIETLTRGRSEDRAFHRDILSLLATQYRSIGAASTARAYFAQRAGSRESLYAVLDETAKAYLTQGFYKEAETILAGLADEIENPIVRGGHMLTIAEAAFVTGDRDRSARTYQAVAALLGGGLPPAQGAGELRQRFERQLRETILTLGGEVAKTRDTKNVARTGLLLKAYRAAFPQRVAPIDRASRDWNDAYDEPGRP